MSMESACAKNLTLTFEVEATSKEVAEKFLNFQCALFLKSNKDKILLMAGVVTPGEDDDTYELSIYVEFKEAPNGIDTSDESRTDFYYDFKTRKN